MHTPQPNPTHTQPSSTPQDANITNKKSHSLPSSQPIHSQHVNDKAEITRKSARKRKLTQKMHDNAKKPRIQRSSIKKHSMQLPRLVKARLQQRLTAAILISELKDTHTKGKQEQGRAEDSNRWCEIFLNGRADKPSAASSPPAFETPGAAKRLQMKRGKRIRPVFNEAKDSVQLPPAPQKQGPTASGKCIGFMCPSGISLEHPMADLLLSYAEEGCTVDCGEDWSTEQMQKAIDDGSHIKPSDTAEAEYAWKEASQKQEEGYCTTLRWSDISDKHPKQLKVSPIAAIPHKSRPFRVIQNLSNRIKINKVEMASVNDTTKRIAPKEALHCIGQAVPRILHAVASAPISKPVLFSKADIQDGFWRIFAKEEGRWNFAYVLPTTTEHPEKHIVVPNSLQMGWAESMTVFCASSETARDGIERLWQRDNLPAHPLENIMMPESAPNQSERDTHTGENEAQHLPTQKAYDQEHHSSSSDKPEHQESSPLPNLNIPINQERFLEMAECCVDDFIGLIQTDSEDRLRYITRGILHGIELVFPGGVSVKKLKTEGIWETRKEALGWIIDGINRTMELPARKLEVIVTAITTSLRKGFITNKDLQRLNGKIRHAALGMPWANGLFYPINKALAKGVRAHRLGKKAPLRQAFQDARTMVQLVAREPTLLRQAIPQYPQFVVFADASKEGAGGTVCSITNEFRPLTFRLGLPRKIQRVLEKQQKGNKNVTNSDLEALGCVVGFLVVATNLNVKGKTMAIFCDNTPAVGWVRRLSARSPRAARLMRILALAMKAAGVSPLITLSIAGSSNKEADFASRHIFSNGKCLSNHAFLHLFNTQFPTKQGCNLALLSPRLASRLISEMLNKQSRIKFWLEPRRCVSNTGSTGSSIVEWQGAQHASSTPPMSSSGLSKVSHIESALDSMVMAGRLRLERCSSRFQPSERPLCWRGTPFETP